ncbi:DUF1552 domain-containing protein [Stieleria sp. TO1_6]|uniref:DUF1552 domain-containing protein n=1 Tax=Stieleria tagensis TaxID=2956795 RepID=UPI00209AF404|nr:DUF1552 domain-containing protein [Stieleria tagensis]MCO8121089.1 DUF1552 domain-containing protein [Stieleria tagensis]
MKINRRRLLKGTGVTVALPALSSLIPRHASAEIPNSRPGQATTANGTPLRMAFMSIPNGVQQDHWFPTDQFELSETLQPLQSVKEHFQVIGGLDHFNATSGADGGGDHARANATFLTGMRARKTAGSDIHLGVSIDQRAAQIWGHQTRLPSLELTSDVIRKSGNCDSGYACAYQYNISWSSSTTPVAAESRPRQVFERLFGSGTRKQRQQNYLMRQASDRSVLDFVMEETRSVEKQLGAYDRSKFEQYTEVIREMERRLKAAERFRRPPTTDAATPAASIPQDFAEHMDMMYDMLILAFQTDATRIGTLLLAHDGSNRSFPSLGIAEGHHYMTHNQRKPEFAKKVAAIDRYYAQSFARFLERMEQIQDIDGNSLLHNSMIVYGGAIADGNRHTHDNLPVVLAGHAGGALQTGRYLQAAKQPMSNLFVSMLNQFGVQTDRFGDSTGPLSELT